jgi:hypothetical protein
MMAMGNYLIPMLIPLPPAWQSLCRLIIQYAWFIVLKKGVLSNVQDDHSVIPLIDKEIYAQLKSENKLFDGILPKIESAIRGH